jgi:hypothetical protein
LKELGMTKPNGKYSPRKYPGKLFTKHLYVFCIIDCTSKYIYCIYRYTVCLKKGIVHKYWELMIIQYYWLVRYEWLFAYSVIIEADNY